MPKNELKNAAKVEPVYEPESDGTATATEDVDAPIASASADEDPIGAPELDANALGKAIASFGATVRMIEPRMPSEDPAAPITTSGVAGFVGDLVHLYCPSCWHGPVAARVTQHGTSVEALKDPDAVNVVDCNPEFSAFSTFRVPPSIVQNVCGQPTARVNLYPGLNDEQRKRLVEQRPVGIDRHDPMWAEWPWQPSDEIVDVL